MTTPSAQALEAALHIANAEDSINRVKDVVADSLRHADPSATVIRTTYFNHTYVPDIVLEWPSRGAGQNREVFLRSAIDPRRIELDVEAHAAERPMFVHLTPLKRTASRGTEIGDAYSPVEAVARRVSSLVTEVSAIDELAGTRDSPASHLLPPTILRGGLGLIDEQDARTTAAAVDSGFTGALVGDRATTETALDVIADVLTPSSATELTSYLETMWIASGMDPMAFPGAIHDLGSHMPPWRLQRLLDAVKEGPDDFWHRVGKSLDLDSFAELNLVGEQRELQLMMATALPKLKARSCRVITIDMSGDAVTSQLSWQVDKGALSLRGHGRQAWIGARKADLPRRSDVLEGLSPSPSKVAARAVGGEIPIQSVELVGNGRSVIYGSQANADIAGDELVGTFDSALGSPSVLKATAIVGSKLLTVDFESLESAGSPNTLFPASNVIWATWMLLNDPSPDEVTDLRSTLQLDGDGQPIFVAQNGSSN